LRQLFAILDKSCYFADAPIFNLSLIFITPNIMSFSYLSNAHPSYIESMYRQYQASPESVASGWREFFNGFDFAQQNAIDGGEVGASIGSATNISSKEIAVLDLIHGYRQRGHLISTTNPIRPRKNRMPHLDLSNFGLSEADLDQKFAMGSEIGLPNASLKEIIERLKMLYCGNIGFEYSFIENKDKRAWLRRKIEERTPKSYGFDVGQKRRILEKLSGAVGFEQFLAKKYMAQKRFGLEGGEAMIPALDAIIERGGNTGVHEVVIGMAHRGRLNVLANIMGKTYDYIFNEFEGNIIPDLSFGDGDVKYHMGFSSEHKLSNGKSLYLKLAPNPSHLEAVNPVVEGLARAKADLLYASEYDSILPILIHGDAAVAGQGIGFEVIQMSQLEGYYTGGTMHFVINNQVGFTTDFEDARSSTYCTSLASVVQAPVFHVNGDDPEAVVFVAQLAMDYRQEFNTDVFIDMVCYRRNGHNEGDDPQFTQPQLYKLIAKHPDPRTIYINQLIAQGEIEAEMAKKISLEFDNFLQQRLDSVRQQPLPYEPQKNELAWAKLQTKTQEEDYLVSPDTSISPELVLQILNRLQQLPATFTPLPKFNRILKAMQERIDNGVANWSMAEHLAYGSLLLDGHHIRMSGQDVKRGTFSHRNAVLVDAETNAQYNRFNDLVPNQTSKLRIYNSLLSEFAVLGFEYGYSLADPDTLVIWEAQFGDFCNGAQTMIDQFISAGESKWQRMSGLVMLLPHGYEGQGPEHSSARFERFLQMCAEFNMTVANASTPANFFHLIRRQLKRPFRKPLIVMSPKSLFGESLCVSPLTEFSQGGFKETIDDAQFDTPEKIAKVKKVVCCTGKIYYDLYKKQQAEGRDDVALIRIEQLYPFPRKQVNALIRKYQHARFCWVQEEPSNMGAWQYILAFYRKYDLELISRKSSASPATGYKKVHDQEQASILERAFDVSGL
jgi:2-oxoglutarate dehydrogenase E1 component